MREGRQAWLVVGAAFTSMFTVGGILYSFGAFIEPMAREFGTGQGLTSVLFAVTAFCDFSLGALTGAIADRVGPRRVVLVGAVAMTAGLALTAVAPRFWLGCVTYGLGVGVGAACGYVPMIAAVGGWFDRRRSLAIGIAVSGIGMGTLVVPPVAALLIERVGWRYTFLALGAASLVLLVACGLAAEPAPVRARAARGPGGVVRSRAFGLLYACGLLSTLAQFTAFAHIVPYAIRLGSAPVEAAGLLSLIGGGSIFGRLALGGAADRLGPVTVFRASLVMMLVSYVMWLLAPGYAALTVFALALGIGYGGWIAITPSVMIELFGPDSLGASVGALYTAAAVGALVGPPIAGFVVDATGGYQLAIVTTIALAAGAVLVAAALPGRGPALVPVGDHE
jgi:predicted MFS family arabinose efflux permease